MANELAKIETQLKVVEPHFEQLLRPMGIPAGRIIRTVLIQCEATPGLLNCSVTSIIQGATSFAVLGLEADGFTGQAYLLPFAGKAQPVIGYKGYNTIGARAGLTITGDVVREGDFFEYELGTHAYVRHRYADEPTKDRRIRFAWAQAAALDRPPAIMVMSWDDIDVVRLRSPAVKGGKQTPWRDPEIGLPAMAAKTVKRRLARSLPLTVYPANRTPQYQYAAAMEEAHEERGLHSWIHPERGVVIDQVGPVAGAEATEGPSVAQLDRPRFVIKGARQDMVVHTIEDWRARMLATINDIKSREALERFRDMNTGLIEDYRIQGHDEHVLAVWRAFEEKLR